MKNNPLIMYQGYTPQLEMITKDLTLPVSGEVNMYTLVYKNNLIWHFMNNSKTKLFKIYLSVNDGAYSCIGELDYYNVEWTYVGSNKIYHKFTHTYDYYTRDTKKSYRITGVDYNNVESVLSECDDHRPPYTSSSYSRINGYYKRINGTMQVWTDIVFYQGEIIEAAYAPPTEDYHLLWAYRFPGFNYILNTAELNDFPLDWEFSYKGLCYVKVLTYLNNLYIIPPSPMLEQSAQAPVLSTSLVPLMTSYTSPSGVVSSSGEYSSTYPAWKAFDDNTSFTVWVGANNQIPSWLSYDFGSGNERRIAKYYILPQMSTVPERSPNSFSLQGSNDGTTWTTLDSRTVSLSEWNAAYAVGQNGITFEIPSANINIYRHYRLYVNSVCGSTLVAIRQFSLIPGFY